MYCGKCGEKLDEEDEYCSNCGKQIKAKNAYESFDEYAGKEASAGRTGASSKSFLVVVVLNILWAGAGYFYLGQTKLGFLICFLNLILIWTAFAPVVFFIIATVGGYKNIKKLEKGHKPGDFELGL